MRLIRHEKLARGVRILNAWRRDSDGVAAIEFALIAPILLIMFFGLFEVARAYGMHRRFISTTYLIGDLVAREEALTDTDLEGIYKSVPLIMGGYPSDNASLKMEIIPLYINAAKPTEVRRYATPKRRDKSTPSCAVYSATADEKKVLESNSKGAIKVIATYEFKPIFNYPLITKMTWNSEVMFAPRQACVAFGPTATAKSCLSPCT